MRHLADHRRLAAPRGQARIGIERDHVAHAFRDCRRVPVRRDERGVRHPRAAAGSIRAACRACAPGHPHAFGFVPDAPAMEQQKSRAGRPRSMTLIQTRDSRSGGGPTGRRRRGAVSVAESIQSDRIAKYSSPSGLAR